MKKQFYIFILIGLSVLAGCKKDKKNETEIPTIIKFSLNGAKAIIYDKDNGTRTTGTAETAGTLLKMDENGTISSAVEGITVLYARKVPTGLFVTTTDLKKYLVNPDDTYQEIPIGPSSLYMGYNTQGDLVFWERDIFRVSTSTVDKLNSQIPNGYLSGVEGNYAILKDGNGGQAAQVISTISGIRYNVGNSCGNVKVLDLNNDQALISDCSADGALMDFTTGNRSALTYNGFSGEFVRISTGIINLSNMINNTWKLYKIDAITGHTELSGDTYSIGGNPGSCSNCDGGYINEALFGTGEYLVIKETNKISLYNTTSNVRSTIMNGYNILSISVKNNKIYFLAETNTGDAKSGIYDIETENYTLSNSTNFYDRIEAF